MAFSTIALSAANALAAAVLVNAAASKMVSPDRLVTALREVVPAIGRLVGDGGARLAAAVEAVAAVALLTAPLRVPAAVLVAVLGACFAALGAAGRLGRGTAPCGCFGVDSDKPLGVANVAAGLALIALAVVNLLAGVAADYTAAAVLLTSILSVALSLGTQRRLVLQLLRAKRAAPAPSPAPSEVR